MYIYFFSSLIVCQIQKNYQRFHHLYGKIRSVSDVNNDDFDDLIVQRTSSETKEIFSEKNKPYKIFLKAARKPENNSEKKIKLMDESDGKLHDKK